MFRKIISVLPFSPALIGQVGFYAKRLRKEELTRKVGIFFVILTLLVQFLAVFQPPESANAANASDMVPGGLGTGNSKSLNNFLKPYDSNSKHLRDVMNYTGITREEIASAKYGSWITGDKLSWGFAPRFSYKQGERQHSIVNKEGKKLTTVYSRPMKLTFGENRRIYGWIGKSESVGWFAIMQACGNLVTNILPPPPPPPKCPLNDGLQADAKDCKPCPGNSTLWINDPACKPNIEKSKEAINLSQGFVNASTVVAKPGDKISYTITTKNTGLQSDNIDIEENLADVLEYSSIFDPGGGSLNKDSQILSWSSIALAPGAEQSRTFVVQLPAVIPSVARGQSEGTSYDCRMTNTYGNSIDIRVECPTPKVVENIVEELPQTGARANVIFGSILLALTAYFYARSRQMRKELREVRHQINSGAL